MQPFGCLDPKAPNMCLGLRPVLQITPEALPILNPYTTHINPQRLLSPDLNWKKASLGLQLCKNQATSTNYCIVCVRFEGLATTTPRPGD